jgi:hypothetical protein
MREVRLELYSRLRFHFAIPKEALQLMVCRSDLFHAHGKKHGA